MAIMLFGVLGSAAVVYALTLHTGFEPGRLLLLMAGAAVCARAKVKLYKASTISLLTSVVLLAVRHDMIHMQSCGSWRRTVAAGICDNVLTASCPPETLW